MSGYPFLVVMLWAVRILVVWLSVLFQLVSTASADVLCLWFLMLFWFASIFKYLNLYFVCNVKTTFIISPRF